MKLLSDDELERSAVVANCRMNRERGLLGTNGYARELGLNPLDVLRRRVREEGRRSAAWLDLCCGGGKALVEAARAARAEGLDVELVGVDLVGTFPRTEADWTGLRLIEASLSSWRPDRAFDLITCVHGLHYIGDKLGLIARAASWLAEDGTFLASLDPRNLKFANDKPAARRIVSELRRSGLEYLCKRRLIALKGRAAVELPYRYVGADDQAGPNFTGQPAVASYYEDGDAPSE